LCDPWFKLKTQNYLIQLSSGHEEHAVWNGPSYQNYYTLSLLYKKWKCDRVDGYSAIAPEDIAMFFRIMELKTMKLTNSYKSKEKQVGMANIT
jgi:hypothetical protein